jgi:hypothetical protein
MPPISFHFAFAIATTLALTARRAGFLAPKREMAGNDIGKRRRGEKKL